MERYYIIENDAPAGPFTIEELRARGVEETAQVWDEASRGWVEVCRIAGLASLLFSPAAEAEAAADDATTAEAAEATVVEQESKPGHMTDPTRLKRLALIYVSVAAAALVATLLGLLLLGLSIKGL